MVNLLGRVPLFQGCTKLDLSRVASLSEERIYREGQVIVKAGDPGKAFYVITNGKAKVVAGTTPGGKKEAELGRVLRRALAAGRRLADPNRRRPDAARDRADRAHGVPQAPTEGTGPRDPPARGHGQEDPQDPRRTFPIDE